jgi:hypothetical protein
MPTQATTLKLIDEAFVSRYSGLRIPVGPNSTLTPVEVFIERPNTEQTTERTFPSISILFANMTPDFANLQHCDDDDEEELSVDVVPSPAERIMRQKPTAYKVQYVLDTWHRNMAGEDRDLVFEAFLRRTPIRGYMTVRNIDGENITVWVSWSGALVSLDEEDVDTMIYHKSLSLLVIAYLAPVEYDETDRHKVVGTVEIEVNSFEEGVSTKDAAYEFDLTTVTRLND